LNKPIVIVNGSGGVGKTTFENLISKYKNVFIVSSVDKIKEAARILDWDGSKDEKSRKFLSDLKLLSIDYNDAPFNYIAKYIEYFQNSDKEIMMIDIRDLFEIDRVKKDFNAIALLIKNNRISAIKTNVADANVENYKYDYIIENNGTLEQFEIKAYDFLCWLIEKTEE